MLQLMRLARVSVHDLSARLGISVHEVQKILAGELFPSWTVTAHFAHECGADIHILRKVWEDERKRRS